MLHTPQDSSTMLTSEDYFIKRKKIIEEKFGTQAAFSRALGISYVGLYKALKCQTRNVLMQEHIARHLGEGVTKESFWPDLYPSSEGDVDVANHGVAPLPSVEKNLSQTGA